MYVHTLLHVHLKYSSVYLIINTQVNVLTQYSLSNKATLFDMKLWPHLRCPGWEAEVHANTLIVVVGKDLWIYYSVWLLLNVTNKRRNPVSTFSA